MVELEVLDHNHCVRDLMNAAEQLCQERGLRLTDQRRAVLEVLCASHVPASAYVILDRLNRVREEKGESMLAPISIYRALDFLLEHGIIHRIESRNAYIACSHCIEGHGDVIVFLLCDECGRASEFQSEALSGLVDTIAARASFAANAPVLEIRGRCADCKDFDEAKG